MKRKISKKPFQRAKEGGSFRNKRGPQCQKKKRLDKTLTSGHPLVLAVQTSQVTLSKLFPSDQREILSSLA